MFNPEKFKPTIENKNENIEDTYDKKEKLKTEENKFKDLEQIKTELKDMGIEEKDIEIVIKLIPRISNLDKAIFPDNPAIFGYVFKNPNEEEFIGFEIPKKNKKKRFYNIQLEKLSKCIKEKTEKERLPFFKLKEKNRKEQLELLEYNPEEFLLSTAAHEVRHRIQYDCHLKLFSPKDAESTDNPLLKAIIEYCELEFEEKEKILIRENKSEKYINNKIKSKEFDARIIEIFVANKIHEFTANKFKKEPDILFEKIISALKMNVL